MTSNSETNLQQTVVSHEPVRHRESAKNHLIAFILSIVLTILAFITVATDTISASFTVPFILGLAVIQAFFQLWVWMHLNQKGHLFAIVGIVSGSLIAFMSIVALVMWMWW